MADINTALNASKDAMEQLLIAGERTKTAWTSPRAPGKWSPSQIVEHVARSLEESANMAAGRPSKFPKLPAVIHPVGGELPIVPQTRLNGTRHCGDPARAKIRSTLMFQSGTRARVASNRSTPREVPTCL